MGRVVRTENLSTERTRVMKAIAIALRELAKQPGFDTRTRDLAAFIVMALENVAESIEASVRPWEKRDYWVKADRFRMEWAWVQPLADKIKFALNNDDRGELAEAVVKLATRVKDIKVPARHRLGTPWDGAWEKLKAEQG